MSTRPQMTLRDWSALLPSRSLSALIEAMVPPNGSAPCVVRASAHQYRTSRRPPSESALPLPRGDLPLRVYTMRQGGIVCALVELGVRARDIPTASPRRATSPSPGPSQPASHLELSGAFLGVFRRDGTPSFSEPREKSEKGLLVHSPYARSRPSWGRRRKTCGKRPGP
jgi:hypothetical protein